MSQLTEADIQKIVSGVAAELRKSPSATLGHDEASMIAAAAARTTVQEMSVKALALMGIDPANTKHLEALKANLDFIQRLRLRSDAIGQSVSNAMANAFALALIGLLALGFFVWVQGWGHLPSGRAPPISK